MDGWINDKLMIEDWKEAGQFKTSGVSTIMAELHCLSLLNIPLILTSVVASVTTHCCHLTQLLCQTKEQHQLFPDSICSKWFSGPHRTFFKRKISLLSPPVSKTSSLHPAHDAFWQCSSWRGLLCTSARASSDTMPQSRHMKMCVNSGMQWQCWARGREEQLFLDTVQNNGV